MSQNDEGPKKDAAGAKPRILMFVDKPGLDGMEKRQRGSDPKRLAALVTGLGEFVCGFVLTDLPRIHNDEIIAWKKSGFELLLCPRLHIKTRMESTSAPASSSAPKGTGEAQHAGRTSTPRPAPTTKETVDFELIESVHRMMRVYKPDQVILVIGDCDYIPLVESLLYGYRVDVRLFLTAENKLGNLAPNVHLLGIRYLCDHSLFRISSTVTEVPITSEIEEPTRKEMGAHYFEAERTLICPDCGNAVLKGMIKNHPCNPNPLLLLVSCPICKEKTPYEDWPRHACHAIKQVANDDGSITLLKGGKPSVKPEIAPASSPPLTVEKSRLTELRMGVDAFDGLPDDQLVGVLRKATSNTALIWLIDQKDRKNANRISEVLARAIDKTPGAYVARWMEALVHIRDEFAKEYPCEDAKKMIEKWMDTVVDWEAIALLIHYDVLRTDDLGRVIRGSLMHKVYRLKPIAATLKVA
jgi:hypothetical protein